jgi:hypothetical protein
MKATCSRVTVIQSFLSFIVGETSSKNGINTMVIKGITKDDVLTGLIPYTTTICTRKIRLESLSLEIYDDIFVPYVIRTDQKKGFVRQGILCHTLCLSRGKVTYQFTKTKYFFDLAHSNSKSNSWRITIHLEYFPPAIVE